MGVWSPSSGEKAAEFAHNSLKFKKVAIINNNNEWSLAVSSFFKEEFERLGGKVVFIDNINPGNNLDYRSTILKLKDKDIDGVYTPITDGVINFYKQYYESGLNLKIITSDIISKEDITGNEYIFQGIYQTLPLNPLEDKSKEFSEKYFKKYNKEPTQIIYNAWGYDSIHLIKEALKENTIKKGLYNLRYDGVSGIIDFDENGSSKVLEKMFIIKNNDFILIE